MIFGHETYSQILKIILNDEYFQATTWPTTGLKKPRICGQNFFLKVFDEGASWKEKVYLKFAPKTL